MNKDGLILHVVSLSIQMSKVHSDLFILAGRGIAAVGSTGCFMAYIVMIYPWRLSSDREPVQT